MNRQIQSRTEGERHSRRIMIQLLCGVSVFRTAVTAMLPQGGAAAWWEVLISLLPGVAVMGLLMLSMKLTHTVTLAEMLRVCLGKAGVVILSAVLPALLLLDGIASITALITLFTEGIGSRGTQLTMAVLTGVILLFSLHGEGFARACGFLRWLIVAAALLWAVMLATDASVDHLFPLYGNGTDAVMQTVMAGGSLSWPLVLLLTLEPTEGENRLISAVTPALAAVGAVLLLTLTIPHEMLVRQSSLAERLLLPAWFVSNGIRILGLCLLVLTFFLAIGASVQLATAQLCLSLAHKPGWLPYGLLTLLVVTQTAEIPELWQVLTLVAPWHLTPLAALAVVCLPAALIRRRRK